MTDRVRRRYRVASGSMVAPPNEYLNGNYLSLRDGAVVLRGHQTDLLRAVFVFRSNPKAWMRFGWQIKRLGIVPSDQFNSETRDRFAPEFAAWRATLPENAAPRAVDFMFLEVYYAATLGATFPALWRNFYISPFNSRKLISLSLKLDTQFRKMAYPVHDMTQMLNPALAGIPYDHELPGRGQQLFAALADREQCQSLTLERRTKTARRIGGLEATGKR